MKVILIICLLFCLIKLNYCVNCQADYIKTTPSYLYIMIYIENDCSFPFDIVSSNLTNSQVASGVYETLTFNNVWSVSSNYNGIKSYNNTYINSVNVSNNEVYCDKNWLEGNTYYYWKGTGQSILPQTYNLRNEYYYTDVDNNFRTENYFQHIDLSINNDQSWYMSMY